VLSPTLLAVSRMGFEARWSCSIARFEYVQQYLPAQRPIRVYVSRCSTDRGALRIASVLVLFSAVSTKSMLINRACAAHRIYVRRSALYTPTTPRGNTLVDVNRVLPGMK
jgi:hypothetical protein